jgi:octaprenyl-diphosphate synthase
LLNDIFKHIQAVPGKQIRPVLILLSAEICGGTTDRTYRSAVLTEMLHAATLLHDDVIDQAEIRRNQPSVNNKWSNKIAVLVGDYLFSETLKIVSLHNDYDLLELMNEAVQKMSEGELIQMENTANPAISEDTYNDIISKKTASFFAAACACGATSANADKETVSTFHQLGWHLGMAFQIKDDLLDILPGAETGKSKNNDIREQKLTLPLIHFLQTSPKIEQDMALDVIQNNSQNPEEVQHLSELILESDSLIYTESKIFEHIDKAGLLLDPFPECLGKTTLQNLMNFIAIRNH